MESAAFEVKRFFRSAFSFLARAKGPEVLRRLGDVVSFRQPDAGKVAGHGEIRQVLAKAASLTK